MAEAVDRVSRAQVKIARVRKGTDGGVLKEGLIYAEVYLPFDPKAFSDFWTQVEALMTANTVLTQRDAYRQVIAAQPDLARLALDPIDSQGEVMLQDDLIKMAEDFLVHSRKLDAFHDKQPREGLKVVQSFVNTPEIASPNFFPGCWVLVVKIQPGTPEWLMVDSGVLEAVSFETLVNKTLVTVRTGGEAHA